MNLFRSLLFWIVLALLGALAAQFLLADPGYVLVRFRGTDYTTTVAAAVIGVLVALLVIGVLWKLLMLPFRSWRRLRDRNSRARLGEGLDALHGGHYARAEQLLARAADEGHDAAFARVAAAQAANARGDAAAAQAHIDALDPRHAGARAIALAEQALADERPTDALVALDIPAIQPLPPRGQALRAQALAATGKSAEAYGLLGALRQQHALPDALLDELQERWAAAALRDAADANALADTWDHLPKAVRSDPDVVLAYADRAAALRWDEAASKAVESALDTRWDESLAARYGTLPAGGRAEQRRANIERWLQAHPSSPALLLALARLDRDEGRWPQAEANLHRALAQGAGADAWEEFGNAYAQAGDTDRAQRSYANALRVARGEAALELPGRDSREEPEDGIAIEERDEHGIPRLRGES
ncbi:heme biosynthesis protein HemY [Pseudoluteimonas lycopersici]|uniref:Heme biosynthesis protein HemY n=1 Tax=Pseudoluteimonas lycopersici TaxID=1324796 RepID=A0A516V629_9GAMM|nr:heme biosynthesis HemY N-terminal domain-containing protein [Lysobacter lycopersici]QDQ73972.1 heme biosynthesis protein HemY [Lysobacter lycopersici]